MTLRITLYADCVAWPLWLRGGPVDEFYLPLSEETRVRIRAWFNGQYWAPSKDWPMWTPPPGVGSDSDAVEDAWVQEGEAIRDLIQRDLGPGYKVVLET